MSLEIAWKQCRNNCTYRKFHFFPLFFLFFLLPFAIRYLEVKNLKLWHLHLCFTYLLQNLFFCVTFYTLFLYNIDIRIVISDTYLVGRLNNSLRESKSKTLGCKLQQRQRECPVCRYFANKQDRVSLSLNKKKSVNKGEEEAILLFKKSAANKMKRAIRGYAGIKSEIGYLAARRASLWYFLHFSFSREK